MATLRQIADGRVMAEGTSEGAVKGWDTRGRGRKVTEGGTLQRYPFMKSWHYETNIGKMTKAQRFKYAEELKGEYLALSTRMQHASDKLEDPKKVKSDAGRWLHFWKRVAEWHDAYANTRDLAKELRDLAVSAYVVLEFGIHAKSVPMIYHAIHWGMVHALPAVANIHLWLGAMGPHLPRHLGFAAEVTPGQKITMKAMAQKKTLLRL